MSDDRGPILPEIEEEVSDHRQVEPGDPVFEHVLFVCLGVVVTVLVFMRGLGLI